MRILSFWQYLPIVFLFLFTKAHGYDSLRLSLQQADSIFLKQNLLLLSGQYNINASEALIIQAKAYPNPVFSAQINAIDPENDRYFNIGPQGQKQFDIEQLLIIGGKRRSSIAMTRQNRTIAESELAELLRNLRLQLHTSFYLLNKYRIILASYEQQLSLLKVIIESYDQQARNGNIPVKDVIRLKTVYLRISNNKVELQTQELEELNKIQALFRMPIYPLPVIDDRVFAGFQEMRSEENLQNLAAANRPDLQIRRKENDLASMNVRLQKQLAIPDPVVSAGYDQRGGAFLNQVNIGLSVPIPVFNRNRGNVKAASYEKLNSSIMVDQKLVEVRSEVANARELMRRCIEEYVQASLLYTKDFSDVFNGVNENFTRRNISILEFVDFFEAYNESLADYHRIKTQLALMAEQINFVTASQVY